MRTTCGSPVAARNTTPSPRIILTLESTRLADGTAQAVRGAGVNARIDAITDKQDNN